MLYEFRSYEAMPGKMPDLNRRFADHAHRLFQKHGFQVVGYWTEIIGESNRLSYLLAWNDLNECQDKWAAFQGDSEWQRARKESEVNGPLVARIHNAIWRPTAYSPMQ